jgi:D-aminopeptidase
MRARDLGIQLGIGTPGPLNAITDVDGVTVGHTTLISGAGELVVGKGPIRTGVTVVCPRGGARRDAVFAGCHRLNGNGELTGLEWIRESGLLTTPVAITNTHSVGVVRDALVAASIDGADARWSLPVVGETFDGLLNDMNGFHVTGAHLHGALAAARGGLVEEGSVGGGTGMICHEFKAVSARRRESFAARPAATPWASSSRRTTASEHGSASTACESARPSRRARCRARGMRWSAAHPRPDPARSSSSWRPTRPCSPINASAWRNEPDSASRVSAARAGTRAATCSSRSRPGMRCRPGTGEDFDPVGLGTYEVRVAGDIVIDELFDAVIEATEEAIVNALVAATTMVGRDNITAYAIPHDRLAEVMRAAGR